MSELKHYKLLHRTSALTSPEFINVAEFGNSDDVYLKSEADKVIAELKDYRDECERQFQVKVEEVSDLTDRIVEKDKGISELKEQIEVLKHQACKMNCMTVKLYNEACDDLIHQKYKRCLAMAYVEWLKQMILCNHPESILFRRASRRERKWKELAEKFKEAK